MSKRAAAIQLTADNAEEQDEISEEVRGTAWGYSAGGVAGAL